MPLKNASEDTLEDLLQNRARIVELSEDDAADTTTPMPPLWLQSTTINLFHDNLTTTTSEAHEKTTAECLPLLTGIDTQGLELNRHGIPRLRRAQHAAFLHATLGDLPSPYQTADAARPWFFYWALAGLTSLGEDVSQYRERLMETVRPLQNPTGGFGGGHGQYSHCACSYATTLALAIVEGLEIIDRKAIWQWLGTIKQSDGGFCMAYGAEEDIRGAYCAMTVIALLNLPLELPPDAPARQAGLEKFTDGLGDWIGRCQTYEGGIAGAPGNEAHGAYAFCALACLCILDAPLKSIPKYLDVDALITCLSGIQTSPEGGFAGRTNKLVDACYSHWVGGCWALIEAAVQGSKEYQATRPDLWNPEALIRYLLCCCQQPGKRGGMRDKPSTRPDGYHTCYSLAGLSAAQNRYTYGAGSEAKGKPRPLPAAFEWSAEKRQHENSVFEESDRVNYVHPVFVIPMQAVEAAREKFADATW